MILQAEIQSLYSTHRVTRNGQQKEKFLSSNFKEVLIDPFLLRLENPSIEPGFTDPRNCLVFWARPPDHVIKLASKIQSLLKEVAPSTSRWVPPVPAGISQDGLHPTETQAVPLGGRTSTRPSRKLTWTTTPDVWLMPPHRMHLTTLEVTHSRTPAEIDQIVAQMRPTIPALADFTFSHRSRLVKPMVSYDLAAFAMSFLPAAGEPVTSPAPSAGGAHEVADSYTYHHLRRDVFDLARTTGVDVDSRYVVPSAHITLGRYLTQEDHATPAARERWTKAIDEINAWLEKEVWDSVEAAFVGEWIVGHERGIDARSGRLWYGGGKTIMMGEGF